MGTDRESYLRSSISENVSRVMRCFRFTIIIASQPDALDVMRFNDMMRKTLYNNKKSTYNCTMEFSLKSSIVILGGSRLTHNAHLRYLSKSDIKCIFISTKSVLFSEFQRNRWNSISLVWNSRISDMFAQELQQRDRKAGMLSNFTEIVQII